MKAVPRAAAVVFAYLCICWAAGSVFVAMIYDYDDLALYLVFFGFLLPVLGVFGALLWLSTPCGALFLAYKRLRVRRTRAAAALAARSRLSCAIHALGSPIGRCSHFQAARVPVSVRLAPGCGRPLFTARRGRWPVAVDFLQCKPPAIVIFPWGGFLSSWEGVIYDAADQINRPPVLRRKVCRSDHSTTPRAW